MGLTRSHCRHSMSVSVGLRRVLHAELLYDNDGLIAVEGLKQRTNVLWHMDWHSLYQTHRQTDVSPLTQSYTSEMAAWLAVGNFKCEQSFLGAILAHIEGRLNFILFTCCQLLAVLLQKPMPMVNTNELPPIYLVLLENRINVWCIFSLSCDHTLQLEPFKSNVPNKAINKLDNQPYPVPEVPIMSRLTLGAKLPVTLTIIFRHLVLSFRPPSPTLSNLPSNGNVFLLRTLIIISTSNEQSRPQFMALKIFFSSVLCLKEPLDKCVCS